MGEVGQILRLPAPMRTQVKSVMHAAYTLPEKEGMAKLRQQAKWLQTEYPDAAASLLEGLEETFTVNRLKLTPALIRCLSSTNIIENPNGVVRMELSCKQQRKPAAQSRCATGFHDHQVNATVGESAFHLRARQAVLLGYAPGAVGPGEL